MSYKRQNDDDDLEELLRKADRVLDGQPPEEPEEEDFGQAPWEDFQFYANYSNNYGRDVRNYQNNYGRPDEPQPEEAPPEPAIPAYNVDFQGQRPHPRAAQSRPPQTAPNRRPYREPDYDEEDYVQPRAASKRQPPAAPKKKHRRKHGFFKFLLGLLIVLLLLAGGAFLWLRNFVKPPQSRDSIGTRKPNAATVLLCGTDEEGTRTDTMMLLYLNPDEKAVNLVSLPRDTLTHTASGYDAKLNSAYGRNNCGEEGMEALLDYVADIIGYRPDGYMLISLDAFVDIVDIMGGVEFDVPMDMFYEDPSQDLYIDLQEGLQKLDGYDAMGLVRFRKGYADQDLGRVDIQRQFISACMDQWLKITNVAKLPKVLSTVQTSSTSDLTTGNILWIALSAWRSGLGNVQTATLPGYADMLDGVSYYILDPEGVADTVNSTCNPYEKTIYAEDLNIVY